MPSPTHDDITLAEVPYSTATSTAPSILNGAVTPADEKTMVLRESDLQEMTLYLPPRKLIGIVIVIGLSFFLSVLEQTILATALPSIASTFKAGEKVGWTITSFLLGSCAVSPFWGRLADIFGRKPVILFGSVGFFVSTLACSVANSIEQLIVFRAFQGALSSGIGTLAYIILSDLVPLTERGKYQAIIDIICITAQAGGPVLGAVLVKEVSWRATFYLLLPFIASTAALQMWLLPAKKVTGDWKTKVRSIDYVGCILSLVATTLLLIAISRGGVETSWTSAETIAPLVVAVLGFAAFAYWEAKKATLPILPLRLFTCPTVSGSHIATFTSMAGQFIVLFYVPNFLQIVRGLSIIISGVCVLPLGIGTSAFVFISIVLSKSIGPRPIVIVGFALWSVFAGLLTTWNSETPLAVLLGVLAFGAVGGGLTIATPMIIAESAIARADRAVVTASRNYCRLLGAAIGTAAAASLVTNDMTARLAELDLTPEQRKVVLAEPDAIQGHLRNELSPEHVTAIINDYVESYRLLFWVVTGLFLFAFVVSATMLRSHSLVREDDEEQKEAGRVWLEEEEKRKADKKLASNSVSAATSRLDLDVKYEKDVEAN